MIELDGGMGEGGGQILRSALALSMVTGQPFQIKRIRSNRAKSGLMRQHLMSVRAAAEVSGARVEGDFLGSERLGFRPGTVRGGEFSFAVGTAGSTMLVLQSILPALIQAPRPSRVTISGGTHNNCAPSFEFIERAFLPLLRQMGAEVRMTLEQPGFYPAGGGEVKVEVEPTPRLRGFELVEKGELIGKRAIAWISQLPFHIAERELALAGRELDLEPGACQARQAKPAFGPGNVLLLEMRYARVTEVMTAIGKPGLRAEDLTNELCQRAHRYMAGSAPVGEYLADQLLLPLALAGGGAFLTGAPSPHTATNGAVIEKFIDISVAYQERAKGEVLVRLS